jgi:hypothetical protein
MAIAGVYLEVPLAVVPWRHSQKGSKWCRYFASRLEIWWKSIFLGLDANHVSLHHDDCGPDFPAPSFDFAHVMTASATMLSGIHSIQPERKLTEFLDLGLNGFVNLRYSGGL